MLSLAELRSQFAAPGRLLWIGLRPAQGEPMQIVERVEVLSGRGLAGDRTAQREGRERQVTLFQHEHLAVLASLLGRAAVEPELFRRNLSRGHGGITARALRDGWIQIGDVVSAYVQ